MKPPSPFSALPPCLSTEASPKAISRRTSYLRVRLEFLRYPQVIPQFFNIGVVRSSMVFYHHFNLAMDRSPGFGSTTCNSFALFRLGFPSAPVLNTLTSLHIVTRRPVLQKVRDHASIALSLLVSIGFQVLFHSPPGVLFTFPSRYYALSVTLEYLALGGGPPCFIRDSSCPVLLWMPASLSYLSTTGLLPSSADISMPLPLDI